MDNISVIGILYLSLLIIPTLIINMRLNIKMNRGILVSIVRMVLQLSLVGLYLQYIFDLNNPFLNVSYILIMMIVASISVSRSSNFKLRKMLLPIFISMVIPNLLMVLFFNAFVINLKNILEARYIITIGGMLLGNVLSGDIIGLTSYYKGIEKNKKIVNYDLALGATRFQATKPYLKDAISASIKPTIATMATIGLVSLPGMMTGQILGGSIPSEAIMYQVAIMIAIYVTRYINIFGVILLSQRIMFDSKDQLIY